MVPAILYCYFFNREYVKYRYLFFYTIFFKMQYLLDNFKSFATFRFNYELKMISMYLIKTHLISFPKTIDRLYRCINILKTLYAQYNHHT